MSTPPPNAAGRLSARLSSGLGRAVADRVSSGTLHLETPDGRRTSHRGHAAGPEVTLRAHDAGLARRLVGEGAAGLGAGYVDGWWDTDDLPGFLKLAAASLDDANAGQVGGSLARAASSIWDRRPRRRSGAVDAMADHYKTPLIVEAIEMAARNINIPENAVAHSDRGSNYTSDEYAKVLARLGLSRSVGRTGSCFDNALAESTNGFLKVELVNRREFPDRETAMKEIARWIELFYNQRRLHSGLGYKTPNKILASYRESPIAA